MARPARRITPSHQNFARSSRLTRRFSEWARQRFLAAREAGDVCPLDVDDFLLVAASPSAWLAKPFAQAAPARRVGIANAIADFVRLGLAPLPVCPR